MEQLIATYAKNISEPTKTITPGNAEQARNILESYPSSSTISRDILWAYLASDAARRNLASHPNYSEILRNVLLETSEEQTHSNDQEDDEDTKK
jgi:hypothetical protein